MSESQEWFYTDPTGAEHGPVSADELQQLGATGAIHALTDVWTEGMDEWVPASQIEGVIPASPPATPPPISAQPAHQPQIHLGPGSGGIHLESSITARPMGMPTAPGSPQASANPYARVNQPKKSPVKWIVLGIIAVVVIVVGIMIAIAPSEEEKRENIAGYAEYTDANKKISATKQPILGNGTEALEIAKSFSNMIKVYRELAIEKSKPGVLDKNGTFPTYCMAKTEGDIKTVVIIVQVPKLRKFADDAKETIAVGAWLSAKMALKETAYDDPKTRLVVGIRGLALYSKVMIGNPLTTKSMEDTPLEGITESHVGTDSEDKLYPFFARKK